MGSAPTTTRSRTGPDAAVLALGVAAATTAAAAVLVIALVVGRAGEGTGAAGALTGWGLPVARLAMDLAGVGTIGLLLLGGFLLPADGERLGPAALTAVRRSVWWAAAWAGTAVVNGLLAMSDIAGRPVPDVLSAGAVRAFLGGTSQGRALLLVVGLAAVLAACARRTRTVNDAWLLLVLAALTVVPPALTGHSAESAGHDLATLSLVLHVLAASAWVGGLGALLLHARAAAAVAATRYSQLAFGCFVAVGVSGLVNAMIRLGDGPGAVAQLWNSRYGWLVLAKVVAFVVLGGFGGWHRARTLPALAARRPAAFARFATAEVVVMLLAVALAVALSRSPTPVPDGVHGAAPVPGSLVTHLAPAVTAGHYLQIVDGKPDKRCGGVCA
jgi:putative copper export protein